ncbi:RNA-guided endonuclease InsQ/TnpB family protein [Iningainema tapete]|uniref:IS200/IS605 family element transposase accessory protein TnpB n=1 Tax=Iningainema tapete BLCC-T55 TaxID=2748662 RepID=A0A8J6XRT8_9CYAN|nr:RNA-guided endonuclease TnpB family protein [Iningainema tapete]MBD2778046.1 IS200/IS605 family element transposase accessory protein TnpB [Iningainema tapete BLCC-T55]
MGIQQNLIYCDGDTKAILTFLCEQSNSLYNCGVYWARQIFFKTGRIISKFDPVYEVGNNIHAQVMPSVPAQQTLLSVSEAFKSFRKLRDLFFKGELNQKPKAPDYRASGGMYKVAYPNTGAGRPTMVDGLIRFPLGLQINRWFKVKEFFLPLPTNLDFKKIKEFTILPKNGEFYLECSYEVEPVTVKLDIDQALSIDLGTSANLMACVDTFGNSFLVDSKQAKSMNQLYNKRVANHKEGKTQKYWDNFLDKITRKRNHQMRDMVNKAARIAVNHCLTHGIGTIVVGWNEGIKDGSDMGKKSNQQFVQMPLAKLKERIKQLCTLYGIRYIETEEANTSCASYLDGDSLPEHGKKPDGWKASGRRIKRGLYRTQNGSLVNADIQAAANILRKVAMNLGINLSRIGRRCLTTVGRIRIWKTRTNSLAKESPRLSSRGVSQKKNI